MDRDDVARIYNGILLGIKSEIMPFAATWMDPKTGILSVGSQTEKQKHHMISFYVESKKA